MTILDYLEDSYCFASRAKVLEVIETERGLAVILDRTIFYPQGGGQPSDHGAISSSGGRFLVKDVRLDENGVVYHFGEFESGSFGLGDVVMLQVEEERRRLHARLHSAGHLIDLAAQKANLPLRATKGYHFPDGPYVEYEGDLENAENFVGEVEKNSNDLVAADLEVETKHYSAEEAAEQGLKAPAGKSVRTVNFEGYERIGCGGTHVKSSGEIGKLVIRKIVSKKGVTKIAYSLT